MIKKLNIIGLLVLKNDYLCEMYPMPRSDNSHLRKELKLTLRSKAHTSVFL